MALLKFIVSYARCLYARPGVYIYGHYFRVIQTSAFPTKLLYDSHI